MFDTSFSRTFSLLESQREFVERFQRKEQDSKALPMLTSACPGIPPETQSKISDVGGSRLFHVILVCLLSFTVLV